MENENKDTINKPNNINGESIGGVHTHTHTHKHIYQSSGRVIKCIIFFIIGLFIFGKLTHIFVPKWVFQTDPATPRIKGFYSEESNTMDVLVIGSSGIGRGYSPVTVWNKYGITSYNLGTAYQTMPCAYYLLKEALKYQNPKVVVLDMDATFIDYKTPEETYRKLFDNMKLDNIKLEAINDRNIGIDDKLSYVFPLLRFHSRWNKLEENDFKKSLKSEYNKVSYKGMSMNIDVKPYIDNKKYMEDKGEKAEILEKNLNYIVKIIDLCEKNNIKLLMTELPSPNSWSLARSKSTTELANKYKIEFIDFNLPQMQEKLKLDWKKHTHDKGSHLNVAGAEIVSKYIGKVLSEKYNCENHKEDKEISTKWKKEVKRYEHNKVKLKNDLK